MDVRTPFVILVENNTDGRYTDHVVRAGQVQFSSAQFVRCKQALRFYVAVDT